MKPTRKRPRTRDGFSLIEVILASALLLGSAVVLSRLAGMGRTQLAKTQASFAAQILCEQTLNEILLGLRPLESVDNVPLQAVTSTRNEFAQQPNNRRNEPADRRRIEPRSDAANSLTEPARDSAADSQWQYSVRSSELPNVSGLVAVTVTVRRTQTTLPRPTTFSLTRWMQRPTESGAGRGNARDLFADFAKGTR